MKRANYITSIVILMLTFLACDNKSHHTMSVINDHTVDEQSILDTITFSNKEQKIKEETSSSVPASSSSSQSNKPDRNDNMRGFDPASEDDMDDNGMSRYMENNDEEGWD